MSKTIQTICSLATLTDDELTNLHRKSLRDRDGLLLIAVKVRQEQERRFDLEQGEQEPIQIAAIVGRLF